MICHLYNISPRPGLDSVEPRIKLGVGVTGDLPKSRVEESTAQSGLCQKVSHEFVIHQNSDLISLHFKVASNLQV